MSEKNVDIKFGSTFMFQGPQFEDHLRDSLDRDGFTLTSVDHLPAGYGGAIYIDNDLVTNNTENSETINRCVDRAIEWFVEDIRIGGAH